MVILKFVRFNNLYEVYENKKLIGALTFFEPLAIYTWEQCVDAVIKFEHLCEIVKFMKEELNYK